MYRKGKQHTLPTPSSPTRCQLRMKDGTLSFSGFKIDMTHWNDCLKDRKERKIERNNR